jgi:hypothetical protein
MTNTDTTVTATNSALQSFESVIAADFAGAVSFFQTAFQDVGAFLSKVASGAEVVITDIESMASYIGAHLGVIQASIASFGALAGVVAPGNATVSKVIADLNTGAADVAALSNALSNGSSASDPTVVTSTVTAIHAVQQLSQIVSNAGATLTAMAMNSPTATQAITAASPSPTA